MAPGSCPDGPRVGSLPSEGQGEPWEWSQALWFVAWVAVMPPSVFLDSGAESLSFQAGCRRLCHSGLSVTQSMCLPGTCWASWQCGPSAEIPCRLMLSELQSWPLIPLKGRPVGRGQLSRHRCAPQEGCQRAAQEVHPEATQDTARCYWAFFCSVKGGGRNCRDIAGSICGVTLPSSGSCLRIHQPWWPYACMGLL